MDPQTPHLATSGGALFILLGILFGLVWETPTLL